MKLNSIKAIKIKKEKGYVATISEKNFKSYAFKGNKK